ncbi:MAG: biotin/lipoyl-containing protein [Chloroflexota bacterium]
MEFQYQVGDKIATVTVERNGDRFQVTVGDKVYEVAASRPQPGQLNLEIDGRRLQVYAAHDGRRWHVAVGGDTWVLEPAQARRHKAAGAGTNEGGVEAPMPGQVREVLVAAGDEVAPGETLALLEAMKMELRIAAPYAGRVRKLNCAAGQLVERGQILMEIEESVSQ